jgi:GNAT superfamily N-acetyltransferase
MMEVRAMPATDLGRLAEIDRSEHIDTLYEVHGGELVALPADIDVPRWSLEGSGPHTVASFVEGLAPIVDRGATLLGALDQTALAGVAIIEERFEGDMAWLAFMHVSRRFRRAGVGAALWAEAVRLARSAGARSMYVSATPSGSAVSFYLAQGCRLVAEPHPALFEKEPEDIHLIAGLG